MDEMKELIDEHLVERVILALVVLGPLAGLLIGFVHSKLRKFSARVGLTRGFALGLLGPLVWGLWRLYSWLVRFEPAADPKDDYFGLERVDVLLLNVVIFVAVGLAVGTAIRLVRRRDEAARSGDESAA